MTDEENERIWRGVHPLRAWLLRLTGRDTKRHPQDKARAVHGKHGPGSERLHNVKRR
jgi:hypothetical protein